MEGKEAVAEEMAKLSNASEASRIPEGRASSDS